MSAFQLPTYELFVSRGVEYVDRVPANRDCTICSRSLTAGLSRTNSGRLDSRSSESDFRPVRILTCSHVFHRGCMEQWLQQYTSCPSCRARLFARPAPPPRDNYAYLARGRSEADLAADRARASTGGTGNWFHDYRGSAMADANAARQRQRERDGIDDEMDELLSRHPAYRERREQNRRRRD